MDETGLSNDLRNGKTTTAEYYTYIPDQLDEERPDQVNTKKKIIFQQKNAPTTKNLND